MVGLGSGIAMLVGIVTLMGGNDAAAIMLVGGAIGRLAALVAAPFVTHAENERKRRDYMKSLGQAQFDPLGPLRPTPLARELSTPSLFAPASPFTSPAQGKTFLFPVFSTRF